MADDHPYRDYPSTAYWSRSVARDFDSVAVVSGELPLLQRGDRVASMGSCFASNFVPHIERAGFEYVRTEHPHPQFAQLPENLGYRDYSAAYGNVYTVRQMLQLATRSLGEFTPREDRWHTQDVVIDPFRPGLAYPASSDDEFDALTKQHLAATRAVFEETDVLVLTLGLTEAWESTVDGAVFPACPGTIAGEFDARRHAFHNFTATEVIEDLRALIATIRRLAPEMRFIVTVSPVPLVATASGRHVLEATTYSKSVLRVAAGEVEASERGVSYFPAYEIVTGPQAPESFFEPDRRAVSVEAIEAVMGAFLAVSDHDGPSRVGGPATPPERNSEQVELFASLSRRITQAECDEELLDEDRRRGDGEI